ncbi:MAG: type II toxin-antitoxin system HicA family toxin [Rhodovibrionaceae bacterium]
MITDSRKLIKALKDDGWFEIKSGSGTSHRQFKHPTKKGRVTVVYPAKDLPKKTVRSVYRQAGWAWPP